MRGGGSWSVYWYNGALVSSEISRGMDIFDLTPSEFLSKNEIDAAKTVKFDHFNVQGQQQFKWPPSFALARAYADQLERTQGLSADRLSKVRQDLDNAEKATGNARQQTLTQLASQLESEASSSRDGAKVRTLAKAVRDLIPRM
jgi:hypothetical protein